MKHSIKRFFALVLALAMCLSLSPMAFATNAVEPTDELSKSSNENVILLSDLLNENGDVMPLGSIGGYAQATITRTTPSVTVLCDCSGPYPSGMGFTIKTSQANFKGNVKARGYAHTGTASSFSDVWVPMNNETLVQNLTHSGVSVYIVEFSNIPANGQFLAQIYIYG